MDNVTVNLADLFCEDRPNEKTRWFKITNTIILPFVPNEDSIIELSTMPIAGEKQVHVRFRFQELVFQLRTKHFDGIIEWMEKEPTREELERVGFHFEESPPH
jgi:hypothetical protein